MTKILRRWKNEASMQWDLRRMSDLSTDERASLETLACAVYSPEVAKAWPGRAIEWTPHQWGVIGWDAGGVARCYVGTL